MRMASKLLACEQVHFVDFDRFKINLWSDLVFHVAHMCDVTSR